MGEHTTQAAPPPRGARPDAECRGTRWWNRGRVQLLGVLAQNYSLWLEELPRAGVWLRALPKWRSGHDKRNLNSAVSAVFDVAATVEHQRANQ